jgi:uncharacterized membrane-anchored protein YjiN (DUF445 family)
MNSSSLKDDPVIVKFLSVVRTSRASINIQEVTREMQALHSTRKSRTLTSAKLSPSRLIDAILTDQACRSRLIEIKTLVYRNSELLSTAWKATRRHIRQSYDLESSTKAERDEELDNLFPGALSFKEEMSCLSDQIDLIVKDIDQTSYGTSSVKDLLKMVLDRKDVDL